MKIAHINYFYENFINTPEECLDNYHTLTGIGEELVNKGIDLSVFIRFKYDSQVARNEVKYYFINDKFPDRLKFFQIPRTLQKLIISNEADLIHVHSLLSLSQAYSLKKLTKKDIPIVVQHHAEKPVTGFRKLLRKKFSSKIDGFLFAAEDLGNDWIRKGNLSTSTKIYEIMEGSNQFNYRERNSARAITGIIGNPVFLWVGRLNENKDPLTVLKGIIPVLEAHPDSKLYMIYSDDDLIKEVKDFINHNSFQKQKIILLGNISHNKIENYYNSSDYFVLGSHYEGSSYSLSEALACGMIPIVTDIPSFRMMTDNGRIGKLWQPGNSNSFSRKAKEALLLPIEEESNKARNYFYETLSYESIADKLINIYRELIDNKKLNNLH